VPDPQALFDRPSLIRRGKRLELVDAGSHAAAGDLVGFTFAADHRAPALAWLASEGWTEVESADPPEPRSSYP